MLASSMWLAGESEQLPRAPASECASGKSGGGRPDHAPVPGLSDGEQDGVAHRAGLALPCPEAEQRNLSARGEAGEERHGRPRDEAVWGGDAGGDGARRLHHRLEPMLVRLSLAGR